MKAPTDSLFARATNGIDAQDLMLVSGGGALGGLLQPIIASFSVNQNSPQLSHWLMGPLLGMAAAGITVFVLANTDTGNKLRLLFFSLLCGLAFPSVLTRAVDTLNEGSRTVQENATSIASNVAKNPTQAATELTKTMTAIPADAELEKGAEKKLEVSADAVVTDLAAKAKASTDDSQSAAAIEKLKEIGTTARVTGYNGVALRVTEELTKIEDSKKTTAANKDEAAEAADAVIGVESRE